ALREAPHLIGRDVRTRKTRELFNLDVGHVGQAGHVTEDVGCAQRRDHCTRCRVQLHRDRPAGEEQSDHCKTSRYFSAPPVLKTTTVSCGLTRPSRTSTRRACSAAPPSGAALMPS